MDALRNGILILAIIVAYVVLVVAGLSFGALWGIGCTLYNACREIVAHIAVRSGTVKEHARVRYFYWNGDWFGNFCEIYKDSWRRTDDMMPVPIVEDSAFWTSVNIAKTVTLVLSFGIFLLVLFLILACIFLIVCLPYTALWLLMRGMSLLIYRIYGLFNLCRVCHQKIFLPAYVCPRCGVEHSRLVPSARFGLFFRRCECGHLLPVLRLLGRSKLRALCPNCKLPLDDSTFAPISIVLVGGPSVGKSQLVMDTVVALRDRLSSELGLALSIPADDLPKVNELVRDYKKGIVPSITPDTAIEAICLEMKGPRMMFPRRLYLYDPPGESFREVAKIVRHRYYEHMRGVIFVIDPSTIPDVMDAYADAGVTFSISQVGAQSAEESLNRWLIGMEQEYRDIVSNAVCAAVISKADEPSLGRVAGLAAGDGDEQCRTFLARFGSGNLLSLLESNFRKVRCFAVGSVGSGGDGKAFSPVGLDEMLKWMLDEC